MSKSKATESPHPAADNGDSEEGFDAISLYASVIAMSIESIAALPGPLRVQALEALMRSAMAEMRKKPRFDPNTRGKEAEARWLYLDACDAEGRAIKREAMFDVIAGKLGVKPSAVRNALKGIKWTSDRRSRD
jgi:hypothetical protein